MQEGAHKTELGTMSLPAETGFWLNRMCAEASVIIEMLISSSAKKRTFGKEKAQDWLKKYLKKAEP